MPIHSLSRPKVFIAPLIALLLGLSTGIPAYSNSTENPERVRVLTSIKPLQLLVKAIAGDTVDVELLLAPQQSPHHYQLRPSDRIKLDEAEQVYWIGPGMETFLARSAMNLPAGRLQTLARELPTGTGHHDHDEWENDPHVWLDYSQILQMSAAITASLSELLPAQKPLFEKNREVFVQQLTVIDQQATKDFTSLSKRSFVMSHAAYSRLLHHYQLNNGIALSDAHGQVAGAKQWQTIENYMREQTPNCFLVDPSEQSSMQNTFLQRYPLSVVIADAMATAIQPTQSGFLTFYKQLTQDVQKCLEARTTTGKQTTED